jgi:hypothetical protein
VIVEGEGAINNTRQRVNREPIVQVEDENRKPVAGAAVTFFLPGQGPGGMFANGGKSLTVMTDSKGQAVMRGFKPNSLEGKFQIRVSANANGQTTNTVINQSSSAGGGGSSSSTTAAHGAAAKWIAIVAVVAGGAAGGIFAATRGGGTSNPAGPVVRPATTLTPGTPVVGAPR